MSNLDLYFLSNKIRTILLTAIDKEILISSKKNSLLINSQNQEQLSKKFINYQNFTIECEESFEGLKNNEDNNIFFDLNCNCSDNKFSCFSYSSKKSNELLFPQSFISKSFSPKKHNPNSKKKTYNNLKKTENNLSKLNKYSGKKLVTKMESSISCKEAIGYKKPISLNNDNNKKPIKRFSADLYYYSLDYKNDDSSKLLNYCYKLKKPNDEIINEISDDDSSTNKQNKEKFLSPHRLKNKNKNIQKKKLKKVINKKMNVNKNNHKSDEHSIISPMKKNSTNFTNEMKFYFDNIEKSNSVEKIKIHRPAKKTSNIELKKDNGFHWKNILHLHHCDSKSPENKSKNKKLEQSGKSFCMQVVNKNPIHKNSHNLVTNFKSVGNSPIILKNKIKKESKEKKEKSNESIAVDIVNKTQFHQKRFNSSKSLCKKNDKFQENRMLSLEEKNLKEYINETHEITDNERKNINISINSYNNIKINMNDSTQNKRNFNKALINIKIAKN